VGLKRRSRLIRVAHRSRSFGKNLDIAAALAGAVLFAWEAGLPRHDFRKTPIAILPDIDRTRKAGAIVKAAIKPHVGCAAKALFDCPGLQQRVLIVHEFLPIVGMGANVSGLASGLPRRRTIFEACLNGSGGRRPLNRDLLNAGQYTFLLSESP